MSKSERKNFISQNDCYYLHSLIEEIIDSLLKIVTKNRLMLINTSIANFYLGNLFMIKNLII